MAKSATPSELGDPRRVGPGEQQLVEDWRQHVLIEAGYPRLLAGRLARDADVDLHRAVDIVSAGCEPYLAGKILL